MSCYYNIEVNCRSGDLIKRHPECADTLCARCGWHPEVAKKRREEVRARYGTKLQSPVHGGHEV